MSNEATGKLIKLFPVKKITETLSVRDFVLEIADGKFPQKVTFSAIGKSMDFLKKFSVGDNISLQFDLRGREYVKDGVAKYFNTLNAWKIMAADDKATLDAAMVPDEDPWASIPA